MKKLGPESTKPISGIWAGWAVSGLARAGLLVGLTLGDKGGAKAVAEIVGQFVKLGVAINLDGLFRGIANHVAVVAPGQMVFQFSLGTIVEDAVQVVGQFLQEFSALHCLPSPLSRF